MDLVPVPRLIVAMIGLASLAPVASAQTARTTGIVREADGRPVQGATIRASHPETGPRLTFATSDSKGRWAMIGLHVGSYMFVVDAPGFLPVKGTALVRTSPTAPLMFTLTREPGPRPGVLPANIQAQIAAANVLRDQGRFDQAMSAYEEIRLRHAALTSINLVIGAAYRQQASLEVDPAARRALLERAIDAYTHLLNTDPGNERAKAELASARAEATPSPN
jgi:tetratricopeptide (TPR) repeat protein